MGIFHHILISACTHSSRYIWKITTRKAYAYFKTSGFLRSLNVKDSMRIQGCIMIFYRTHVSASYNQCFFHTPTYGVLIQYLILSYNNRALFLKNRAVKTFYSFTYETQDSVIQYGINIGFDAFTCARDAEPMQVLLCLHQQQRLYPHHHLQNVRVFACLQGHDQS